MTRNIPPTSMQDTIQSRGGKTSQFTIHSMKSNYALWKRAPEERTNDDCSKRKIIIIKIHLFRYNFFVDFEYHKKKELMHAHEKLWSAVSTVDTVVDERLR